MTEFNDVPELTIHDEAFIEFTLDADIDILRESAEMDGLPYMPLLPSYEAFILREVSYSSFLIAYSAAIQIAIAEGANYADLRLDK